MDNKIKVYFNKKEKLVEKNNLLLFGVGLIATILNVYLFVWSDVELTFINIITKYVSEWIMVIALIGLAKRYLNFGVTEVKLIFHPKRLIFSQLNLRISFSI